MTHQFAQDFVKILHILKKLTSKFNAHVFLWVFLITHLSTKTEGCISRVTYKHRSEGLERSYLPTFAYFAG